MERRYPEVVGVRRTGWAALDRDPQEDRVEYVCPHCGKRGQASRGNSARTPRDALQSH